MVIWLTPAGTTDDGGLQQPAYLNFELSLLGPPTGNEMKVRVLARCYAAQLGSKSCSQPAADLHVSKREHMSSWNHQVVRQAMMAVVTRRELSWSRCPAHYAQCIRDPALMARASSLSECMAYLPAGHRRRDICVRVHGVASCRASLERHLCLSAWHGFPQGIVGETYSRRLLGDAILNPEHALYQPDDYKFHGNETDFVTKGFLGAPL